MAKRRRLTSAWLVPPRTILAAPKPTVKTLETTAHPNDENFDPEHASKVVGDIAEQVRDKLAKDYDCRPPGLQTIDNGDGSLTVIADNSDVGIGVQIQIGIIPGQAPPPPVPQAQMGIGPPPPSPGPMPSSVGPPTMGIGPPPAQGQAPGPMPGAAGPPQF
jgi:hypothetical protein